MRDRIKELRRVPANSIRPNPANWRQHPERQINAMTKVLEEIGIAAASIAYEDDNGDLVYIDGHMREEILGDELVPVLILDVNEQEAHELLLTMDPLSAMATTDEGALEALLNETRFESELEDVLTMVGEDYGLSLGFDDKARDDVADEFALVKYEVMVAKADNTPELHRALMELAQMYGANFRVLGTD